MSIADKIEDGLDALASAGATGIEIALTDEDTLTLFNETSPADARFGNLGDGDLTFQGFPIRRLSGGVVRSAVRGRKGASPVSHVL